MSVTVSQHLSIYLTYTWTEKEYHKTEGINGSLIIMSPDPPLSLLDEPSVRENDGRIDTACVEEEDEDDNGITDSSTLDIF